MSIKSSREILDFLFFESTKSELPTEGAGLEKEAEKQNKPVEELSGSASSTLKDRLKDLVKILTDLGLKNVKDRLEIKRGAFYLNATSLDQHTEDSTILMDLTKITPLIDKNFAAIDVESSGRGWAVIILAADLLQDPDLTPDFSELVGDDMKKGKENDGKVSAPSKFKTEALAKKLAGDVLTEVGQPKIDPSK